MAVKQLSIFVENRAGTLVEITRAIADANIDIRALSIADTTDYGILRLIVNDSEKAVKVMKDAGFTASVTEVIGVLIDDTPGGFSKAVETLSAAGINIEYAYAFISPTVGNAYVILRVEDNAAAENKLREAGIAVVTQEEIDKI